MRLKAAFSLPAAARTLATCASVLRSAAWPIWRARQRTELLWAIHLTPLPPFAGAELGQFRPVLREPCASTFQQVNDDWIGLMSSPSTLLEMGGHVRAGNVLDWAQYPRWVKPLEGWRDDRVVSETRGGRAEYCDLPGRAAAPFPSKRNAGDRSVSSSHHSWYGSSQMAV
jgi:hypothetical protein